MKRYHAVWPAHPIRQDITAVAATAEGTPVWTGGRDGTIIQWRCVYSDRSLSELCHSDGPYIEKANFDLCSISVRIPHPSQPFCTL